MKKCLSYISRSIMLFAACACSRLPQTNLVEAPLIVFMGNSITQNWPSYDPDFWQVEGRINKGIGGQVTSEMLERFQRDVVDKKPDLVIILGGTNDIAGNLGPTTIEETFANIKAMTGMARQKGIAVALASVLPVAEYPWNAGQGPLQRIPALNSLLRNYAGENGIIYVDYYTEMVNDEGGMIEHYAYDGVHPNEAGYAVMRSVTLEVIGRFSLKKK